MKVFQSKMMFLFLCHLFLEFSASGVGAACDVKVLVIGGGPAGIQAAATLKENGIDDYLILEATDELGAHLKTVDFGGRTFAPGYIWGYTPDKENLDALGVAYKESNYDSYVAYNELGEDITSLAKERENELDEAFDNGFEPIKEDIKNGDRPDISQKCTLARGGWIASTDIDKALEWYVYDFYEGRSTRDISAYKSYVQSEELVTAEYLILDDRTLAFSLFGDQEAMLNRTKIHFNSVC